MSDHELSPAARKKMTNVFLPLVLSPLVASAIGLVDPGPVSNGTANEWDISTSYTLHTYLFLFRAGLQAALTVYSFFHFWEILRRDFVPQFLMPSIVKNPALFEARRQCESKTLQCVAEGRYRQHFLDVYDPETQTNARLECGVWEHPRRVEENVGANGEGRKWILYLNANGVAYQDILPFTIKFGTALKANVLNVNYRGVQGSSGFTTGSRSLLADAECALAYLRDEIGVKLDDILVHGHSMGGAVAVCLASRYSDANLKCVADRTFARLPLVIAGTLAGMQGMLFGIIFSVAFFWIPVVAVVTCASELPQPTAQAFLRGIWIVGVGVQSVTLLSRQLIPKSVQMSGGVGMRLACTVLVFLVPTIVVFVLQWVPLVGMRLSALIEYLFFVNVTGALCGYLGLLRWPLSRLAELMDWGIDPRKAFDDAFTLANGDAGNVLVICHKQDGVVPYAASLSVGLGLDKETAGPRSVKSMVLSEAHPNCHMMLLDTSDATWYHFLEVCSRLMYR